MASCGGDFQLWISLWPDVNAETETAYLIPDTTPFLKIILNKKQQLFAILALQIFYLQSMEWSEHFYYIPVSKVSFIGFDFENDTFNVTVFALHELKQQQRVSSKQVRQIIFSSASIYEGTCQ